MNWAKHAVRQRCLRRMTWHYINLIKEKCLASERFVSCRTCWRWCSFKAKPSRAFIVFSSHQFERFSSRVVGIDAYSKISNILCTNLRLRARRLQEGKLIHTATSFFCARCSSPSNSGFLNDFSQLVLDFWLPFSFSNRQSFIYFFLSLFSRHKQTRSDHEIFTFLLRSTFPPWI